MWEGWSQEYNTLQLGPQEVKMAVEEEKDPGSVGFAFPLSPVEFAFRNERKYPPPTDDEMYSEMARLIHQSLAIKEPMFKSSYVLSIIYSHINRNKRDSPGWQRGLIKAGGVQKLVRFASSEDERERYWAIAILGRMVGTCEESRKRIIEVGAHESILAGTKDGDEEVRDCGVSGLKGLIQYPEGRTVVSYDMLIECLSGRGK